MRKHITIAAIAFMAAVAHAQMKQEPIAPELETAVKTRIADKFLDPAAAQIRNVRYYAVAGKPGWVVCAEVNGKNSFGGYTGFEPVAAFDNGEVFIGKAAQACSRM